MKKLLISTSIAASFVLVGCGGGEDLEQIQAETPKERPASRIVFDPTAGDLPLPTDLLFALAEQTDDGTLEVPDEIAGQANGATPDFTDPGVALGGLDGWSTQHPFRISINHPDGITLGTASAGAPGAVRIFEGAIGGDLNDDDCRVAPPLTGCKIFSELTYGVDFITQAAGDDIAIIPVKPFKGSTSYYVAVTKGLRASDGRAIQPSSTYNLVRLPIATEPLATDSQRALQGLVNSYEAVLTQQGGLNQDDIIFSYTFTTQSTTDIVGTVKQLQIGTFAGAFQQALAGGADQATALQIAGQFLPAIPVTDSPIGDAYTALGPVLLGEDYDALAAVGLTTCSGLIAAATDPTSPLNATALSVFPSVGAFCAASVKQGTIDLPYYLSTTAPLTERWDAACTNGLALQTIGAEQIGALLANGTITAGVNNDLCQAASGGTLLDLDLTNLGITDLRHLTRYSPIPARKGRNADGTETLQVQITVPDPSVVAVLAANPESGLTPIAKPESGWPVVILQHGITSKKEDMLAIVGALSVAGFATVAIDHPLHASRGFEIDGQIINTSNGFDGRTTDYLNLASLLTARDNTRQSIVDTMGLRLGLNAVVDLTGGSVDLDPNNVSFVGVSLGSITGIGTLAMSNASLGGALADFDSMYEFKAAVLSVPGGGVPAFLLESASFGPLVKASLLAGASADFQAFLGNYAVTNQLPVEQALIPAYLAFDALLSDAQRAEINTLFGDFVYAAQTTYDSADPNNFAALLGSNTPVLLHEVVGGGTNDDGSTGLPDQVIPNNTLTSPSFAGTDPLARFIGLQQVSSSTEGSGLVRFTAGSHSSIGSPATSLATTTEMQRQMVAFLASGGNNIVITDTSVVEN